MSDHTLGEELAGVAAELAGLTKAVDALTEKVGVQNGRISKLESKAAGQEGISVGRTRTEIAVEGKMDTMDERVKNLETYRDTSKGKTAATLGIFQTIATIVTLLVALYTIIEARPQPAPAAQHQVK